ncbi:unnamed protein product, partial [Urochloa humidicola]
GPDGAGSPALARWVGQHRRSDADAHKARARTVAAATRQALLAPPMTCDLPAPLLNSRNGPSAKLGCLTPRTTLPATSAGCTVGSSSVENRIDLAVEVIVGLGGEVKVDAVGWDSCCCLSEGRKGEGNKK